MSCRLLNASLLALIAIVSLVSRTSAKPPDLPDDPVIIVQGYAPAAPQVPLPLGPQRPEVQQFFFSTGPLLIRPENAPTCPPQPPEWHSWLPEAVVLNIHPLMAFLPPQHFTPAGMEELCDEPPQAPRGCTRFSRSPCDKHACGLAELCLTRSVLDNLEALEKAEQYITRARKLVRRGKLIEAAACLAKVGDLCPGSHTELLAQELMTDVIVRLPVPSEEVVTTEEEQEAGVDGCHFPGPLAGCLMGARQFGMCQAQAVASFVGQLTMEQPVCDAACWLPLEGKLGLPISVHYTAVPLATVLDQLRAGLGAPIVVEQSALTARGVSLSATVSMHLHHAPVRHVLDLLVRPMGLEPVVRGGAIHLTASVPVQGGEEACEPCPRARQAREACCAGTRAQVDGLLKACYLAVESKRYAKAAELARQAHALDPARVEADPLVYKMHLLGESGPVKDGPAIDEPAGCPFGGCLDMGPFGWSPADEAGYHDERAFRFGDEEEEEAGRVTRGLFALVLSQFMMAGPTDHTGGWLQLGLAPTGRLNLYLKAPVQGTDLYVAFHGPLPLVWIRAAK